MDDELTIYKTFDGGFTGHEYKARSLLLERKIVTIDKMALMTSSEVYREINKFYKAIPYDDDWILIKKEDVVEFEKFITMIYR